MCHHNLRKESTCTNTCKDPKLSLMYQRLGSTKHKAVSLEVLLKASQNAKSKVLYCFAVK